jgi:hypothetical protein
MIKGRQILSSMDVTLPPKGMGKNDETLWKV